MERKFLALMPTLRLPAWVERVYRAMTGLERVVLLTLVVLCLGSGVASLLGFISRNTELIAQDGGVYHEAAVGQPRNLNPILASANDLDLDMTRLIYSGLLRHSPTLGLVNDLATNAETSANQLVYTVSLRSDVTWHDGEPFTADDVVFTIRSIQTKDYGSPLFNTFQGVTVEKVDDHTVRFSLSKPYPPFLSSLTVGIAPAHVWSQISPQNATLAEQMLKPIGTGPFKFAEIITRRKTGDITSFRLVRSDTYFRPRPHLDEIVFTFFSSHEEALQALVAGDADGVGFLPLSMLDQINSRTRTIHRLLLPQYFALFFNQQDNEVLTEAAVRAALALATNRQQIVAEALHGQGEALHLPLPPATIAYDAYTR